MGSVVNLVFPIFWIQCVVCLLVFCLMFTCEVGERSEERKV